MPRHQHTYEPLFPVRAGHTQDRVDVIFMGKSNLYVCYCGKIADERRRGYSDEWVSAMKWREKANEWRTARQMPPVPEPKPKE